MPQEFIGRITAEINGEIYQNGCILFSCREVWISEISNMLTFEIDPLRLPERLRVSCSLVLEDDNEEILEGLIKELTDRWPLNVITTFEDAPSGSAFFADRRALLITSPNFDSITLMWWMILLRRLASKYSGTTTRKLIESSDAYDPGMWYHHYDKKNHLQLLDSFHPKIYAQYWIASNQQGGLAKGPMSYKNLLDMGYYQGWK